MKKAVSGVMLAFLLTSMLTLAFDVRTARAETGTVYIRADGSIDPPSAPISTVDNVTYTLTGNITSDADGIVVERDNIVIDGNGCTVQGNQSSGTGISLTDRSNVTIKNTNVKNFYYGIDLEECSNNTVSWNNATANYYYGISLGFSSNNTVSWNNAAANGNIYYPVPGVPDHEGVGISLFGSSNNIIEGNNVTAGISQGIMLNEGYTYPPAELIPSSGNIISGNIVTANYFMGISFWGSCNNNTARENNVTANGIGIGIWFNDTINMICHNSFIGNGMQADINPSLANYSPINSWNDICPSGGNYWSDYTGTDLYSGPYQNETGSDGMGDTPYVIDENNTDYYPLMNPWNPTQAFNVTSNNQTYSIELSSNATVQDFSFDDISQQISFNSTGESPGTGYCRLVFPKEVMNGTFAVLVNGMAVACTKWENSTHIFLYFTYHLSLNQIRILLTVLGDINGDRLVDMMDIGYVASRFLCQPGDSLWNPNADFNGDGLIDMADIGLAASRFLEHYP